MNPLLLIVLLAFFSNSAAGWPRFRGPNGSGVDPSTASLPSEFGPGKAELWSAAVPFGRSSPIVAGGRVFLTASEGNNLVVVCLDPGTGRLLWRRDLKRAHDHRIFRANDPASPTPASDGANVYVFFPGLGLVSFTHDGKERWRHPLGPFHNYYGMSSSPVVSGDLVVLSCDQQTGSYLLAVDRETGRTRWMAERPGMTIGFSVPIDYSPPGEPPQLVLVGTTRVDSYYRATGERRWWIPIGSDASMGSPVVDGETLLIWTLGHDQPWMQTFEATAALVDSDRDGKFSHLEFQKEKSWSEHFGWIDADSSGWIDAREWNTARMFGLGDYGVAALRPDGATGQLPAAAVRWRFKRNLPYVPAPVLYQGVYFMVRTGGIITSLDPATGALHKQGRTEKAPGEYWASPVAAAGKVFLLSEEGKLTVLRAAPRWEILAVNDLGEEAFATPAVSGGRLFVRTRSKVYCFGE